MEIILLGISHKTAPVKVREKYSLPLKRIPEILNRLSQNELIDEVVILSTCNRTEIYAVSENTDAAKEFLQTELQNVFNVQQK